MAFAPGMAKGLASGLQNYQESLEKRRLEAKEDEKLAYARQFAEDERTYNRGRNTVADQQAQQTFNQQQLANGLAIGAAQRKDEADKLNDGRQKSYDLGSGYVISGNTSGLADLINPMIPSGINDEMPKVIANVDGTSVVNVYSKSDPTKLIRSGRTFKDADELFSYMQPLFDPTGARAAKAKLAEEQRTQAAEIAKEGRQHKHALELEGLKSQNSLNNTIASAQASNYYGSMRDSLKPQSSSATTSTKAGIPKFAWEGANSSPINSFLHAISGQESSHNYSGPDSRTGAMGRFQVQPQNLNGTWGDWGKDVTGKTVTPAEFKNNPTLQDQIAATKLQRAVQQYGLEGAARWWYSGTAAPSDKRPKPNEPSPNEYAASVLKRMKAIDGGQQAVASQNNATQIASTIGPLTTQILGDFKGVKNELGTEVLNGAQVRGALTNAATLLNKAVAASDPSQKIKFYNDAGTSIALALTGTGLSEQQITDYKNSILTSMVGEGSNFAGVANKVGWNKPQQLDPEIEAAINGAGGAKAGKPAGATQAAKPPAAQPNIATIVAATTNAPKPHRMQLDAVKKEIGVIQSAIKSGQASPLQQAKLNERLKDLTKALPDSRHISLSDTVGTVTEPFRFKLQTGLPSGAGSAQSNSLAVDNQMNMEARKQLGL